MSTNDAQLAARNAEIGAILVGACKQRRESISACAQLLGTSQRRYADIEAGKAAITAVELELLLPFLGIPAGQVWRNLQPAPQPRQVIIPGPP